MRWYHIGVCGVNPPRCIGGLDGKGANGGLADGGLPWARFLGNGAEGVSGFISWRERRINAHAPRARVDCC